MNLEQTKINLTQKKINLTHVKINNQVINLLFDLSEKIILGIETNLLLWAK